jgi:transcription elongation factor GreA
VPYYITKQGLYDLQEEYKKITEIDLPEIQVSINEAREDGDLKENAGYQSALKVRDELEAKLNELEVTLNDYEIIEEDNISISSVQIGNTVTIKFLHSDETMTFKIVGTSESNILENKVSNESPIAQAVLGKKVKQQVEYKAPRGKTKIIIQDISQ